MAVPSVPMVALDGCRPAVQVRTTSGDRAERRTIVHVLTGQPWSQPYSGRKMRVLEARRPSTARPRPITVTAATYQFRQKLFHAGLKLRQLPQGLPHPRRPLQPPLKHRFPQTNWTFGSPWLPVRPEPATTNTASRIAANRSDTVCPATGGRGSMTRSAASLEIVEPSNSDTPTAPTGAIPDMMLRYFCHNFIRFSS
jgi:hypothetical protein